MSGNDKELWDYVDLFFLHLAKLNRKKIGLKSDNEFYDSFFTDTEVKTFFSGLDRRRTLKHKILKETVLKYLPNKGKLLDVGCGIGDNLYPFKDEDIEITGIEYSVNSLEFARKLLPASIELKNGSATSLPFDSSAFDGALCIEVLEHIDDQAQVLREINRVIRPDGFFILSVPYRHWFPSYYKLMGHFRHYTKDELSYLLNKFGFTVEKWLPNYPNWHRFANYCYISTRILAIIPRIFGKNIYPHQLNWPFTNRSILTSFYKLIDNIYEKDKSLDYSTLSTSTFILARKANNTHA